MIPMCRDKISTRPAGADFTLRLHGKITFHRGKMGQFSTWYLFKCAQKPLDFHGLKMFCLSLQLCLFLFHKMILPLRSLFCAM